MLASAEDLTDKVSRVRVHMAVFAEASWKLISDCQLMPLPGAGWSLAECSSGSLGGSSGQPEKPA